MGSFFSPLFVSYFPSRVRGHGSIKRAGVFISFPVSFLCVIGKGEGFQVSDRFLVFFLSLRSILPFSLLLSFVSFSACSLFFLVAQDIAEL